MMRRTLLIALLLAACSSRHDEPPLATAARLAARDSELSNAIPILHVRSFRGAAAYYREVLGFQVLWDWGSPPDFGAVRRGDATLFLCQGCTSPPGAWTMIFARDVDKLHAELRERNAVIRLPPTNMPWGTREMHVADPDGNVIRFGSSIPE